METKNKLSDILVGLHEVYTFVKIFNEFAQNFIGKEKLEYVNGVVSMISMQSAKIDELIKIADSLETELEEELK